MKKKESIVIHEVQFNTCMDGVELINFINKNSKLDWNKICDISQEFKLYGDEGRSFGYIHYNPSLELYKPTKNKIFFQKMINKFYEAYGLDKNKDITVLFTD